MIRSAFLSANRFDFRKSVVADRAAHYLFDRLPKVFAKRPSVADRHVGVPGGCFELVLLRGVRDW